MIANTYFLIRHGESVYNLKKLHQGWTADTPLTDKGKKQSAKIGRYLKKLKPDLLITSPFVRAMQTAKIISSYVDLPVKRDREIIDYRRSRQFEGLHYSKYINDPKYLLWKKKSTKDPHFKLKDGESLYEFGKRLHSFARKLDKSYSGKKIVIVTHRDAIIELLRYLTREVLARSDIGNAHIFRIDKKRGKWFYSSPIGSSPRPPQ